jgi:hypothetical protein
MPASAGMEEPKFIIKLGDKYYVSVAVLEYDPNHPGATQAQKEGAAHIAAAFDAGQPKLQAVQVSAPSVSAHYQTGPSH